MLQLLDQPAARLSFIQAFAEYLKDYCAPFPPPLTLSHTVELRDVSMYSSCDATNVATHSLLLCLARVDGKCCSGKRSLYKSVVYSVGIHTKPGLYYISGSANYAVYAVFEL